MSISSRLKNMQIFFEFFLKILAWFDDDLLTNLLCKKYEIILKNSWDVVDYGNIFFEIFRSELVV